MVPALEAIAKLAAERMLNSVIAGLALTILAWAFVRLVVRTNSRTRAAVWYSVSMAVALLSPAAMFLNCGSPIIEASPARITIPVAWALVALLGWVFLAGAGLLRLAVGLCRIRKLRRASRPIDLFSLDDSVVEIITRFAPHRPLLLLQSETARVPMAVGFFQPAVILPQWALAELSSSELSSVLLHEFAHLGRWDDWSNLFQKILCALFFFHPALWWLDRQLALERELACDDMVLATTQNAHAYARCLVGVAEKSFLRRGIALAQAAVHGVQQIAIRIRQIMDSTRPRDTRLSKAALATIAALALSCLLGVLRSPILVGFQDQPNRIEASASLAPAVIVIHHASATPALVRAARSETKHDVLSRPNLVSTPNRQPSRPRVLAAKFDTRREQQNARLADALAHPRSLIPVQSMLLVVTNSQIDATGRVTWTMTLWRVTRVDTSTGMAQQALAPNAI
jgi:beta-lactamase regulating signal transducer with metallopeptidase domain